MPDEPKDNKKSRSELLGPDDYRQEMPEVIGCDDVLVAFHHSGMATSGGMGISSLTWQEINAMVEGGAYNLNAWAKRQVFAMSSHYCSMLQYGKGNVAAPFAREQTQEELHELGLAQLRAMERAEAKNNSLILEKKRR